jgi:hypothetical protein
MGLLDFLVRLFFPRKSPRVDGQLPPTAKRKRQRVRLVPRLKQTAGTSWARNATVLATHPPYVFARFRVGTRRYLDLSKDRDFERLTAWGLPVFDTPAELAAWLGLRMGQVAWLVHRFCDAPRPETEAAAHYHFRWIKKRRGGMRLIESPKRTLKTVQHKILREVLKNVRPHSSAHGFEPGRSILTNAAPHVGSAVIVKCDLSNFYATVTFARVTAIFRGFGYSREAAIWLARLTTSALPANIPFLKENPSAVLPYLPRHLPQGAPTSPALANLSAYSLDVRLSGLSRRFGATYTRYADDLTFSGPKEFSKSLRTFIPLVKQIIRSERFSVNASKTKVLRRTGALVVTGVVVNEKCNVRRREFDRLKALLTNCVRHGPATQNRDGHPHFAAHLRGRIAHLTLLNPDRGGKLLAIYEQIDWNR